MEKITVKPLPDFTGIMRQIQCRSICGRPGKSLLLRHQAPQTSLVNHKKERELLSWCPLLTHVIRRPARWED